MKPVRADALSHDAGQQLLDCIRRVLRSPSHRQGWVLLALRLSRIAPPSLKPRHRRAATAVLEDAASRANGHVFSLGNDLALLFRPPDGGAAAAGVIARLFRAELGPASLHSVWPLPGDAAQAVAYVRSHAAGKRSPPMPPAAMTAIAEADMLVRTAPLHDLLRRQTAVLLRPGHAKRITPLFREITMPAASRTGHVLSLDPDEHDPFLLNHLAGRVDCRLLAAMLDDIPADGPFSSGLQGAALHLNLTLSGILSEEFATLATFCQPALEGGLRIAIELPFAEAFADPKAFLLARERLRLAKLQLVLDHVDHRALALSNPSALLPHLVKLAWSPAMAGAEGLPDAIARTGPGLIVLHDADTEAALTWGLGVGIQRFQGRYVDMTLAAERLRACSRSLRCTLRQCGDRATATAPSGRLGCDNLALLDMAAPSRMAAA